MALLFPPNACDCHFHVYDPQFPYLPMAKLKPKPAGFDAYQKVQKQLGINRAVVVQPSSYGTDNRCTLLTLSKLGENGRAVIVVDPDVAKAEIARFHALGVRGIRFNFVHGSDVKTEALVRLANVIAEFDWHLQINMDAQGMSENEDLLRSLNVPLIFDHGGRILNPAKFSHSGWLSLRRLIDQGNRWVKLSAPYVMTASGNSSYDDAIEHGRRLLHTAPERIVWGSDWPHVTEPDQPPSLMQLSEFLSSCVETDALLNTVLVSNPANFYNFSV